MNGSGKDRSWIRDLQKKAIDAAVHALESAGNVVEKSKEKLQEVDEATGTTDKIKEVGGVLHKQVQELDQQYGLREQGSKLVEIVRREADKVVDSGTELVEKSGAKSLAEQSSLQVRKVVIGPLWAVISQSGLDINLANK